MLPLPEYLKHSEDDKSTSFCLLLTQEKLAEIVGVRRETIIFLEKGKYNPSLKLAHNIARALESSIEDIFIMDDD